MKAVIQRVRFAQVEVNGQMIGKINQGILAYIGLGHEDTPAIAHKLVDKILGYRLFVNEAGKLDYNLAQVNGGLLLVSQFTLLANTQTGRRADFKPAMSPSLAAPLFAELVTYAKACYPHVQTGEFGADMQVTSCNDGPITFLFEC